MSEKQHGGFRPGAGRKPSARRGRLVWIGPVTQAEHDAIAMLTPEARRDALLETVRTEVIKAIDWPK